MDLAGEIERLARNSLARGEDARPRFRGRADIQTSGGQILTSAAAAEEAKDVRVQFQDGSIEASVGRGKEKP